jgi:L-alanine-DL-glutamate epimerase-like enolase superfamily enzyme
VWVRVTDADGTVGWGEAAPNAFYAESAETVTEALLTYGEWLASADLSDIGALEARLLSALPSLHPNYPPHPAARSALSAALLDLLAKRANVPVWKYLGLKNAAVASSFTIGIDDLEVMRAKARAARGYQILKVKVGTPEDTQILAMLREEAPHARIRVDANTGWTAQQTIDLLPILTDYGVELIEQPVAVDDFEGFGQITRVSKIPVIADESCRVAADVDRLAGRVHGVNIKLAKCGSLGEAMRIAEAARDHGMQVMLGCMIESTLGIAAAIQLASLADYVDLDGAALLAEDPFRGPHIDERGNVVFNEEAGLGVSHN